jgi:uncharacterized damage-inducible protein DinB
MSSSLGAVVALALLVPSAAQAQQQVADPLVNATNSLYEQVKSFITRSAEQVPEADYTFRPVPEVRTFGELVAHVANAHYMFCSSALGEANPNGENLEETKTSKADLQAALAASFEYCDRAYTTMTDADATQIIQVFGAERPKLHALNFNVAHDMEHYGNMVTYMRIKGMTPPSSQRGN